MLGKFFGTVAFGSLFVGGLAVSHLAFAQPGPGMAGGPRGGGLMAMADANKDGTISKAELTAGLEARFAKMDIDKDGQLTGKDRDLRQQQRMDSRFAMMDTDKNGQISKAEFVASHQARMDKRAEARKAGGPQVRRWAGGGHHRGAGRDMMGGGRDGDRNGMVTKAEFMARPLALFDRADANKDGKVTADEMKAARQAMRGQRQGGKGSPPAN